MSQGTGGKTSMNSKEQGKEDNTKIALNLGNDKQKEGEQVQEEPKKLKLNIGAQSYIPKNLQYSYGKGPNQMQQSNIPGMVSSSIYHQPSQMLQSTYLYQMDGRKYYQPPQQQFNPLNSISNAPTPENIQKMIKTSKPFFPKNARVVLNKDDLAKTDDDKKAKDDPEKEQKDEKSSSKLSGLVDNKDTKVEEEEKRLKKQKEQKEKEEQDRLQKEKEDQERLQKEKDEQERLQKEKDEQERLQKEKEEQDRLQKEKEEEFRKKFKIESTYFLVPITGDQSASMTHGFSLEYMMSFKPWKICQESKLLPEEVINHLARFKVYEEEIPKNPKDYQKNHHNKRDYDRGNKQQNTKKKDKEEIQPFSRGSSQNVPTPTAASDVSIGQWGRKDITKELEQAEIFKEKMNEIEKKDPIKYHLTELLNILTVDNYDDTKELVFDMVKESVEYQEKFLDVLFTKAVNEKAFVFLYAKLCKDLDKKLPQKSDKVSSGKKPTSAMRSKLLDKSREIFKIENNTKFDSYIRLDDPDERELKMKKFVLGNVNFISELINIQVLSKKIVFQCIENLFKRYEKEDGDEILHLINLEAIVIMMDKFGTLIKKQENKIKDNDLKDFNAKVDEVIGKLDTIQKEKKLPGFIKYKIINLIEKKKDGWEESQFEKVSVAKGKEEVRKEYEDSLLKPSSSKDVTKYSQETINEKIRVDLSSWKDHIDNELKPENYQWEIVEDLISNRKHSISEILLAYVENCIDFVSKADDLEYATVYFKDFISFYSHNLKDHEKDNIVAKTIELLQKIYNFALDNQLLIDVWGSIIYYLIQEQIMVYSDFNSLEKLVEEDVRSIFQVFKKVIELDQEAKSHFSKVKLVKDNIDLFSSITDDS